MFAAWALPEAFLQREQWQYLKPVSGALISNLTAPQRQLPLILSDAMPVPSLEKIEPPRCRGRRENLEQILTVNEKDRGIQNTNSGIHHESFSDLCTRLRFNCSIGV